jgi:hypothetical protein
MPQKNILGEGPRDVYFHFPSQNPSSIPLSGSIGFQPGLHGLDARAADQYLMVEGEGERKPQARRLCYRAVLSILPSGLDHLIQRVFHNALGSG